MTENLYPLVDGKTPIRIGGKLGVYYAGTFVPVVEVEGDYFTEQSYEEVAREREAQRPEWNWEDTDVAASATAEEYESDGDDEVLPSDTDGRTVEVMRFASQGGIRPYLLSNSDPLELLPEDDESLEALIALFKARNPDNN